MAEIRGASLGAHAAARAAKDNQAARFAAPAAGQDVATAHVPQHAFGAACYSLKAMVAQDPQLHATIITGQRDRHARQLPPQLRVEWTRRVSVGESRGQVLIRMVKRDDF